DRQIMDEDDRDEEEEGAEETAGDDAAPRQADVAGPAQNGIAYDSAERVADHAGKKDAGREERRVLQVEVEVLHEERWDPTEEQPQRPAIAEIDERHRQDAARQLEPRDRLPSGAAARRRQRRELRGGHLLVLPRLVAEERVPAGNPDEAGEAEHDEGAAPGDDGDERRDKRRRDGIAEARERMGDALGKAEPPLGYPAGHGARRRREGGAFAETEG